jgi:release factor glutamine methyltransferase
MLLEVIQRSTDFLARKGVDSPRLQVELLLAHALKMPRLQLYLNFERALEPHQLEAIREMVRRRGSREPLQHIVGSTSFCGLEILVSRDVLIPRPETERLAELGWQFLNKLQGERATPAAALDFGTGSGCISIALASKAPQAGIYAMDPSEAALKLARTNAERNQVAERIEFVCAGRLDEMAASPSLDLIISNPPYIPSRDISTLAPEVRDFDPRLALDGGEDGLNFFRYLAKASRTRVAPGGRLMLEHGDSQGQSLEAILRDAGWTIEAAEKDLNGRARIVVARIQPD